MKKITKDTNLTEVLKIKKAQEILEKFKIPCLSCPMARYEIQDLKIGEICEKYEIDLKKLLKELNENRSG